MPNSLRSIVRAAQAAPYNRILVCENDGGYSAEVLEFPGCYASGSTADEAMRDLDEAIATWVRSELEQGHSIPEPIDEQFSGRVMLRILPSLHRQAAIFARAEGSSLNRFLATAIAFYVGARTAAPMTGASELGVRARRPARASG
ncbi:MAG: type II toxin-antitoxin system HicB family antitoxin [Chloroflexi bacterium]|nr:type II toxin-antitoxin system HicB family antitoxin [Chloroflexota bacterium]